MIWIIITVSLLVMSVGGYVLSKRIKEETQKTEEVTRIQKKLLMQIEQQRKELEHQNKILTEKESKIRQMERDYEERLRAVRKREEELKQQLEELTGKSREQLYEMLKKQIEEELSVYKSKRLNQIEEKLQADKEELAKKFLIEALQDVDHEFVDEFTTSRIKVPNPDIKGKIIGKEGRNIRAFEQLAKVDIIINEDDDYITISSYDPVRREVAKLALLALIKDGRIHPSSIESAIERAKVKVSQQLVRYGKELAKLAGLYNAPSELLALIGRMKFRRSNGQDLYTHTAEVIQLSEGIARKLNLDVKAVKLGALLHDIGKVLTSKIKKPHHHISADIARKYGFSEKVINIVEAHHDDIPSKFVECEVLKIADKISTLRPGARKDTMEQYVDRIKALEKKVSEVVKDKAEEIFALKAGRELRVIVKPTHVSDDEAPLLAYDIAKAIEESGVFPGEVQVVVIRETRSFAKAKKPSR